MIFFVLFLSIDNFQPSVPEEQAGAYLEQERQRNQAIEQVINDVRQQNPNMEEILSKMVEWWTQTLTKNLSIATRNIQLYAHTHFQ